MAEYLEQLILADLGSAPVARVDTPKPENGTSANAALDLISKHDLETRELLGKVGEHAFVTRAAFVNFVLAWAKVQSGAIDPRRFDWERWCTEMLERKGN